LTIVHEMPRSLDSGKASSAVRWFGIGRVDPGELDRELRRGWAQECVSGWDLVVDRALGSIILLPKPNLTTNSGVDRIAQRLASIGGPAAAMDSMGVDNGTTNPGASTDRSADGFSTLRTILAFDSTATYSRPVLSCVRTYTNSTVAFPMKRLFLSAGTGDAAGTLVSMTNVFTVDLTAFSSWSQTFTAQMTFTGS
jgi:hypothetical protein